MIRVVLFVMLMLVHVCSAQNFLENLDKFQSDDGSFGDKNPEIVSSTVFVVLTSFTSEDRFLRNHELIYDQLKKYLVLRSEKLIKSPLDQRHIFVAWALANQEHFNEDTELTKSVIKLGEVIVDSVIADNYSLLDKFLDAENLPPFILALHALNVNQFCSVKIRKIIIESISRLRAKDRSDNRYRLAVNLIASLWLIKELPEAKPVDWQKKELKKMMDSLNNDSSKIRKLAFNKCLYMNRGKLSTLLKSLRTSNDIEHKMVAEDLNKAVLAIDWVNPKELALEYHSIFWKFCAWGMNFQEENQDQEIIVTNIRELFVPDIKSEKLIKAKGIPRSLACLTQKEDLLIDHALSALILESSYKNLLVAMSQSIYEEKFVYEEDGLDLVE